jgi:hypothetical protein
VVKKRVLGVLMAGRCGVAEAAPSAVTAAGMMAGHVTLDVSCIDRLYLSGYVPRLQTPGGVIYFFHVYRGEADRVAGAV